MTFTAKTPSLSVQALALHVCTLLTVTIMILIPEHLGGLDE